MVFISAAMFLILQQLPSRGNVHQDAVNWNYPLNEGPGFGCIEAECKVLYMLSSHFAEYFRSHLLAFSSNLDDHNPDVAEWRLDVSWVIKNALIQVRIS